MIARSIGTGGAARSRARFGALPWRSVTWWALSLLCGVALAGAVSVASWFALSGGPTRDPMPVELTIPPGTYERIRSGAALSPVPSTLEFVQGDTLIVRNRDAVQHQIGPFTVPPGGMASIPLTRASSQSFLCSFHPAGVIGLDVQARSNPWTLLWPTLLLGVPFGVVIGAVGAIVRRIRWE